MAGEAVSTGPVKAAPGSPAQCPGRRCSTAGPAPWTGRRRPAPSAPPRRVRRHRHRRRRRHPPPATLVARPDDVVAARERALQGGCRREDAHHQGPARRTGAPAHPPRPGLVHRPVRHRLAPARDRTILIRTGDCCVQRAGAVGSLPTCACTRPCPAGRAFPGQLLSLSRRVAADGPVTEMLYGWAFRRSAPPNRSSQRRRTGAVSWAGSWVTNLLGGLLLLAAAAAGAAAARQDR